MKRLAVGIALAVLLPNCIQANPVAEQKKPGDQQFSESIGPFCDDICQRGSACGIEVAADCASGCRDHMAAFVGHGEECVTLGQGIEDCLTNLRTCDELGTTDDCDPSNASYEHCAGTPSDSKPPSVAAPVYCDGSSGSESGGFAPSMNGQPSQLVFCDIEYDNCSDGSDYRVSCHPLDGTLVCNCFRDGTVSGVAFTPGENLCLGNYELTDLNGPCGWNIQ